MQGSKFVLSEIRLLNNDEFLNLSPGFTKRAIYQLLGSQSLPLTSARVSKIVRKVYMTAELLESLQRSASTCGYSKVSVIKVQSWIPEQIELALLQSPNDTKTKLLMYLFMSFILSLTFL